MDVLDGYRSSKSAWLNVTHTHSDNTTVCCCTVSPSTTVARAVHSLNIASADPIPPCYAFPCGSCCGRPVAFSILPGGDETVAVVVFHHMKTCEWRRQAAERREKAMAAAAAARGPAAMKVKQTNKK